MGGVGGFGGGAWQVAAIRGGLSAAYPAWTDLYTRAAVQLRFAAGAAAGADGAADSEPEPWEALQVGGDLWGRAGPARCCQGWFRVRAGPVRPGPARAAVS